MVARNFHRGNVYVAQGTVYGTFLLYGLIGADFVASNRRLQFDLHSANASRFPADLFNRDIDDGIAHEFCPIIIASQLDLAVRYVVLPVLWSGIALANASGMGYFLEIHMGNSHDHGGYLRTHQEQRRYQQESGG